MSYIEKNLMVDERIIYRAKLHWIIFRWLIFWLIITSVVFATGIYAGAETENIVIITGVLLILSFIFSIRPVITYATSEFGITNKRVVVKMGFIRRSSLEVLLNKVEGIMVDQSILGRILDYGSIRVSGTGGTIEPIPYIGNPFEFRKKVQEQVPKI